MGKLVIDGNKIYTVDEECMKKKNLTLTQIQQKKTEKCQGQTQNQMRYLKK